MSPNRINQLLRLAALTLLLLIILVLVSGTPTDWLLPLQSAFGQTVPRATPTNTPVPGATAVPSPTLTPASGAGATPLLDQCGCPVTFNAAAAPLPADGLRRVVSWEAASLPTNGGSLSLHIAPYTFRCPVTVEVTPLERDQIPVASADENFLLAGRVVLYNADGALAGRELVQHLFQACFKLPGNATRNGTYAVQYFEQSVSQWIELATVRWPQDDLVVCGWMLDPSYVALVRR